MISMNIVIPGCRKSTNRRLHRIRFSVISGCVSAAEHEPIPVSAHFFLAHFLHRQNQRITVHEGRKIMTKLTNALLASFLAIAVCGCSSAETAVSENSSDEPVTETQEADQQEETVTQEEDMIDDPAWDTFESLGQVETENGLFFVSVTLPADLVGEDVTQESIDAGAGETYTSGTLNEDGSVTYKMTKRQHKNMLETLTESIDEALKEMCDSDDYAISEITHNNDFTEFDVKLTTEELGLAEGFLVLGLYMYGGMYSIFRGKQSDIKVNYYSASGELLETANSADLGE